MSSRSVKVNSQTSYRHSKLLTRPCDGRNAAFHQQGHFPTNILCTEILWSITLILLLCLISYFVVVFETRCHEAQVLLQTCCVTKAGLKFLILSPLSPNSAITNAQCFNSHTPHPPSRLEEPVVLIFLYTRMGNKQLVAQDQTGPLTCALWTVNRKTWSMPDWASLSLRYLGD